jgi:hypothetical protein
MALLLPMAAVAHPFSSAKTYAKSYDPKGRISSVFDNKADADA